MYIYPVLGDDEDMANLDTSGYIHDSDGLIEGNDSDLEEDELDEDMDDELDEDMDDELDEDMQGLEEGEVIVGNLGDSDDGQVMDTDEEDLDSMDSLDGLEEGGNPGLGEDDSFDSDEGGSDLEDTEVLGYSDQLDGAVDSEVRLRMCSMRAWDVCFCVVYLDLM